MKNFWKDYWNLCKESGKFYKKHWFGIIIYELVAFLAIFAGLNAWKKISEKKLKKDNEINEIEDDSFDDFDF